VKANVDPGSDPRRADDRAIVHEAAVGVNRRLRGDLPQQVNGPVVGRRLQAVEQPGFAKSKALVQTDSTSSASWERTLIQSVSTALCISRRVP
jgi:hypothetical protein